MQKPIHALVVFLSAMLAAFAQSPVASTFVAGLQLAGNPTAATALFDVLVTDPTGIVVRQVDCNLNTAAGTTGTLGVYVTAVGGTAVGNELLPAAWTQVGTATRTHAGGRTSFVLQTPFFLAPGTYGMALHHVGMNPVYTNPTVPVPPLPNTYATTEITLNMTSARVRASTTASAFGAAGLGNLRHPNIALFYVPGPVFADFTATPVRGASPLNVQFEAQVASGNPGGVQAVLWDFDNDSVVDATGTSASWTYGCGNFTVTMTMIDTLGGTVVTKNNFVQTDIVVPSFRNQLVAATTVQFTDTSSPPAQTWAWDLNGDGLVDSTVQSPQFTYTTGCTEVNVTVTMTRNCQPPVVLAKRIAVANTIDTTFQGGLFISATATGGANFLDVDVTNPLGITVCGMHVNSAIAVGATLTVNVFHKQGTYVGSVETAAPWRLVGTATTLGLGGNQRAYVTFTPPIHLPFGVQGLAIEQQGASPQYSNLGSAVTYTVPDCTITTGLVQAAPIFGPAATSTQFTPRVWNGALHFGTTQSNGAAGYGHLGAGCVGSLGVPGNRSPTPADARRRSDGDDRPPAARHRHPCARRQCARSDARPDVPRHARLSAAHQPRRAAVAERRRQHGHGALRRAQRARPDRRAGVPAGAEPRPADQPVRLRAQRCGGDARRAVRRLAAGRRSRLPRTSVVERAPRTSLPARSRR